ncbi:MAG TPA: CarD family transcriptional regulator, partial [Flavobacteriaceae bacterium]|nr:CarD family transcriptional regulator [Flavobacteriaceae bacterium]
MSKTLITQAFSQTLQMQNLQKAIGVYQSFDSAQDRLRTHLKGLVGSSFSFVAAEAFTKAEKPFLIICNDKEEAAYYLNDLEQLVDSKHVLFYPGSYRRPYQIEETDNANVLLRAEVLNRINSRKKPAIVVTYPEALFEQVVTRKELERNTLKISVGDDLSIDFVNEVLFEYKFKRVDFVTEPGEFSVRGGIVDVFSFSHDEPYRIEFFGNEVDSIRTFDVETQLSTQQIKKINIIPNVENKFLDEKRESFLQYIDAKTVVFLENAQLLFSKLDDLFQKAENAFKTLSKELKHATPEELFCSAQLFKKQLLEFNLVEFGSSATFSNQSVIANNVKQSNTSEEIAMSQAPRNDNTITFNTTPQPAFNKQFNLLIENLNSNHDNGYTNYIACVSEQQAKRFADIFNDVEETVSYKTFVLSLHQGFIDHNLKIVCYTDHQIFERYHKFQLKNGYAKKQAITLKELTNLEIGDYVTHIDHGVGKFGGLQKIEVEGKKQEAIKLIYGDRDILYLSIHSLHKITKFN